MHTTRSRSTLLQLAKIGMTDLFRWGELAETASRPGAAMAFSGEPFAEINGIVIDGGGDKTRIRIAERIGNILGAFLVIAAVIGGTGLLMMLWEQFTLSELQQVYEAILDREMDKRNFRRRMLSLGIIKPAGGTRMEGAHRPAQLFTFTRREPVTV